MGRFDDLVEVTIKGGRTFGGLRAKREKRKAAKREAKREAKRGAGGKKMCGFRPCEGFDQIAGLTEAQNSPPPSGGQGALEEADAMRTVQHHATAANTALRDLGRELKGYNLGSVEQSRYGRLMKKAQTAVAQIMKLTEDESALTEARKGSLRDLKTKVWMVPPKGGGDSVLVAAFKSKGDAHLFTDTKKASPLVKEGGGFLVDDEDEDAEAALTEGKGEAVGAKRVLDKLVSDLKRFKRHATKAVTWTANHAHEFRAGMEGAEGQLAKAAGALTMVAATEDADEDSKAALTEDVESRFDALAGIAEGCKPGHDGDEDEPEEEEPEEKEKEKEEEQTDGCPAGDKKADGEEEEGEKPAGGGEPDQLEGDDPGKVGPAADPIDEWARAVEGEESDDESGKLEDDDDENDESALAEDRDVAASQKEHLGLIKRLREVALKATKTLIWAGGHGEQYQDAMREAKRGLQKGVQQLGYLH
jgi:hypothetical protein